MYDLSSKWKPETCAFQNQTGSPLYLSGAQGQFGWLCYADWLLVGVYSRHISPLPRLVL